ncbi:MAG: hypothetical protein MK074_01990 [Phycisphaerales bacterium]|nr:hypothetical protein [Phycisphaerales bacterium]
MRRGVSLLGMLISLVCLVVLAALMMEGLSKGGASIGLGGGEGRGGVAGSAMGLTDSMNLNQIFQSMHARRAANPTAGLPHPSKYTNDSQDNVSDAMWSLLIAENLVMPKMLVSQLDDGWVEVYERYDYGAIDPSNGYYWDPGFSADLHDISNVSFAHVPLHGKRAEHWTKWRMDSSFPLVGNRGPEDGDESLDSVTCPDGRWQGAVVFGDGHVETLKGVGDFGGGRDNLFMIDDPGGSDAILGFTQRMGSRGPVLQWD